MNGSLRIDATWSGFTQTFNQKAIASNLESLSSESYISTRDRPSNSNYKINRSLQNTTVPSFLHSQDA
ncbi:unnamed protein product [Allacma fusca]|uniref:Uncharacterized protein n=1 Tax=Allacma fusca TaxID=39272 RepID=A0A8J2PUV6_9HEXA|nr:unnamed protein product [Allacma fusca]